MTDSFLTIGIETSCDETSCAVVADGRTILSNVISSQASFHEQFGGVVPEIASRMHVEAIGMVISQALKEAGAVPESLGAVCVTRGPGLVGALLVGQSAAKAFAAMYHLPLLGVHHIQGHIAANYLCTPDWEPPFMCLVASGGHSQIIYVEDYDSFIPMATTRDDAAGEAFDKIARVLGLGYPGGPKLEKAALAGSATAYSFPRTRFADSFDFSFSGVKTSAIQALQKIKTEIRKEKGIADQKQDVDLPPEIVSDFAASFQEEITGVLSERLFACAQKEHCSKIALAGGVAANQTLRKKLEIAAKEKGFSLSIPPLILCTDNAAMIASAGYFQHKKGYRSDLSMNASPSLDIRYGGETATAEKK